MGKSNTNYKKIKHTIDSLDTLYGSRVTRDAFIEGSTISSRDDYFSDIVSKQIPNLADDLRSLNKKIKKLRDGLDVALKEYSKVEKYTEIKKGKTLTKLANSVIAGKFGNGKARIKALKKWLKKHGYKYSDKQVQKIQDKVNKILGSKSSKKKKKKNSKTGAVTAAVEFSAITGATAGAKTSTSGSSNKTKAKKKKKVKTLLKVVTLDKKTTKKDQKIAELKEKNVMLKKKADEEAVAAAATATALKKVITDFIQCQDAIIAELEESNAKSIEDLTKQYDEKIEQITQKNAEIIENKNNEDRKSVV